MSDLAGYRELEHTADWALEVWAPDLSTLFVQAARGMYSMMETSLEPMPRLFREISLSDVDAESLLVRFLSELLYMGEADHVGFDRFEVMVDGASLRAVVEGARLAEQRKEIKAVTYHNLQVCCSGQGCIVTIVFDV